MWFYFTLHLAVLYWSFFMKIKFWSQDDTKKRFFMRQNFLFSVNYGRCNCVIIPIPVHKVNETLCSFPPFLKIIFFFVWGNEGRIVLLQFSRSLWARKKFQLRFFSFILKCTLTFSNAYLVLGNRFWRCFRAFFIW